ncbi:MAG: tetratricopeptide repeat protein [Phycisphaerales bacterium]
MIRPLVQRPFAFPLLLLTVVIVAGCHSTRPAARSGATPYAPASDQARDSARAHRLTRSAVELIDDDPEEAERLLREALAADLWNGAAHNNLGVVLLNKGDLYGAASEFEWARKLMPGHPDPRLNLALTLDRAGRIDDAMEHYEAALEVYPGHIPSTQGLLRAQVLHAREDQRTGPMLERVALQGETEQWREWAKRQLTLREQ